MVAPRSPPPPPLLPLLLALLLAAAAPTRGTYLEADEADEGSEATLLLTEREQPSRVAGGGAACRAGARCVHLRNCRLLAELLDRSCLASDRLRAMTCGYVGSEPLVCCPRDGDSSPMAGPDGGGGGGGGGRPDAPTAFTPGCGRRLVAGAEVGLGAQPWVARIAFKHVRSSKLTYPCCGSIIAPRTVLTAAHCALAKSESYKLSTVVAGDYDSRGDPDCTRYYCALPSQTVAISHVVVHPGYERATFKHDVALLVLKTPLNYSPTSPRQQQLELPVQPVEQCAKLYSHVLPVTARQLCAGGEAGRDACAGFGGAPLLLHDQDGSSRSFQVGMASFGSDKCGAPNVPSVYTNVIKYSEWIKSNMVV